MMKRFKLGYDHSVVSTPSERGFEELEVSARKLEGCGKQILLSFTGDPYCGVSPETTTRVLDILLKYGLKGVLHENGIRTWASFEPVIKPEQSLNLLSQVAGFIDHVKIGKINNYKGIDRSIDWQDFTRKAVAICRESGTQFYIKEDLAQFNRDVFLYPSETNVDYLSL
ncbi:hypothetical protein Barb7_00418 [Bacteroidales bacterium Barb7]|nr:hypothetical protein Barb7_00418 [Bacteroidales bacterium Barb7]